MKYLKAGIFFLLFLAICTQSNAQLGKHKVIDSYRGKSLKALDKSEKNLLQYVKQKHKGVEVLISGLNARFFEWKSIEKTTFGLNEYRMDIHFEDYNISLHYAPYPYESSDPVLKFALIEVQDAEGVEFWKCYFVKED